jgi:hypothetical protein
MKRAILAVGLLVAGCVALAAQQATVTGKWQIQTVVMGNESTSSCTFEQKDNVLTGTCERPGGQAGAKITGKVDGAKVTLSLAAEYEGNALTVDYTGTLKDGVIKGTVLVSPFGVDGEFTATPQK